MGLRRNVPHGPVAAPQLLDERDTDAKEVSYSALGAHPPLDGAQNLLS
jgi:hypothetical protein